MRWVPLTVLLACTPAPASRPPDPTTPTRVAPASATAQVCIGTPYTTDRDVTLSCCYIMPNTITRVVRGEHPRLRACYHAALARQPPELAVEPVRVTARFTIGDDGSIPHVCVQNSDIDDGAFLACIAAAMSELEFPETAPGSGCPVPTVAYPLTFVPKP